MDPARLADQVFDSITPGNRAVLERAYFERYGGAPEDLAEPAVRQDFANYAYEGGYAELPLRDLEPERWRAAARRTLEHFGTDAFEKLNGRKPDPEYELFDAASDALDAANMRIPFKEWFGNRGAKSLPQRRSGAEVFSASSASQRENRLLNRIQNDHPFGLTAGSGNSKWQRAGAVASALMRRARQRLQRGQGFGVGDTAAPIKPPGFPSHWTAHPRIVTTDWIKLPFGYGMGSSTTAAWIRENTARDRAKSIRNRSDWPDGDHPYGLTAGSGNPNWQRAGAIASAAKRRARALTEKKSWETVDAAIARIEQEDAERAEIAQDAIARARRRITEINADRDAKAAPALNAAIEQHAAAVAEATGKTQVRAAQQAGRENAARRRAERQAARERRRLLRVGR